MNSRCVLLIMVASCLWGCGDIEMTSYQESLVERCIRAGVEGETRRECDDVTVAMERSFLEKHPRFREEALAEMIAAEAKHTEVMARLSADRQASEREKRLVLCAEAARYAAGECPGRLRKCEAVDEYQREEVGKRCKEFNESEIRSKIEGLRQDEKAQKSAELSARERATAAAARSSERQ